jgi:peptidoglycan/LPS O-acetylase OafA/YrhL
MMKENIPLTSIRGLLAIWVVGHHWFFSISNPVLNNFFGYAYYSVDIFFILSGFVLTLIYKNIIPTSIPKFYLKRILRVFPLHFFALIILTFAIIHPPPFALHQCLDLRQSLLDLLQIP